VHLVASSVPELPIKNVTVVDQNGNLLSETGKEASTTGMDPSQIKVRAELQQSVIKRIESIITPIVGPTTCVPRRPPMSTSREANSSGILQAQPDADAMAIRSSKPANR